MDQEDWSDCDLDTLSALLEEDDDVPSNEVPCQSSTGGDACDLDTLSAMLEEDSEEEQETEKENCQTETKSPASSNIPESRNEDSSHESALSSQQSCDTSPHTSTTVTTTNDNGHVKRLQDELLMMQQRMMQIQQMLASQSSSPTTVSSSSSPIERLCDAKEEQKVKGSSKRTSTLSSTPPSSSKTNSNSQETRKPTSSPASVINSKKPTPSPMTGMGNKNKVIPGHQLHNPSTPKLHNSSPKPNPSSSQKSSGSGAQRQNGIGSEDISKKQSHTSATGSSISKSNTVSKGKGGPRVQENGGPKQKASTFLADVADSDNGSETKIDNKTLKQNLFGEDDSDSDWEDSVENKSQLSDSGLEMKRLLSQGQKQREAHTPSYPISQYTKTPTWKTKVGVSPSQIGNASQNGTASVFKRPGSSSASVKKEADDKDCMTEKFSGLRIKNPKVSSVMLSSKMDGRRMIQLSRLPLKIKSPELQGDWVTIGVIVKKSESRKSQTGKTYSIWKLSDLQDAGTTVSFFLFGNVYKQLWKLDVGNVLGILNPSIMDNAEKGSGELAFTVNNALQVMEIGQSKDLGWCLAKTKNGNACSNFVNRKLGDFCTYHVQAAYRKHSAKRGELHSSCPGRGPKSSLKDKILQNNTFFYGGESFSSVKGKGNGSKDRVTMAKLQSVLTQQDQRKINTLAVQNLMPSDKTKVQAALSSQHEQPFLNMLAVPTAGSMNLVRHIAHSEDKKKGGVKGTSGTIQSVMAADLLKQHREEIAERLNIQKQKQKLAKQDTHNGQGKSSGLSEPRVANGGPINRNERKRTANRLEEESVLKKVSNGGQSSKKTGGGSGACSSDQSGKRKSSGENNVDHNVSASVKPGVTSVDQQSSEKTCGPMIGKGFYPGGDIDLFAESSGARFQRKPSSADEAKARAVQKIMALGGVEKMDPNAVRGKKPNLEKIKKRVLDNNENESKTQEDGCSHQSSSEPARKKSRLLGNVDLSSQEVKQLLNAKSSHTGALAQAEADREERYFDNLEKKEMMEEKMKTVTSMEVTVFTCEQCKYTAMSQADRCKQERHAVRRHKGKRRFFACKKCKHRTVTLQRYPSSRCTKCGEHSYEKTSMYHEKSGPKLESETLCLRGDESKFVNSMDQKVFMATLQQDA